MLPRGIKERGSLTGLFRKLLSEAPTGLWALGPLSGASLFSAGTASPQRPLHQSGDTAAPGRSLPGRGRLKASPGVLASRARASGQGPWAQGPAGPRPWPSLQPPGLEYSPSRGPQKPAWGRGCPGGPSSPCGTLGPFPAAKLTSTCLLSRPLPGWGGGRLRPEQPLTRAPLSEVPGQRWGARGPAGLEVWPGVSFWSPGRASVSFLLEEP